ncbi:unnamed protein product [Pipistrellus nathusii]|uniref:Uncharacterized protein n=1 Tax=Pipistrellus nathusii TaxID=59473 RepID=A0ABP0AED9_PIPNA
MSHLVRAWQISFRDVDRVTFSDSVRRQFGESNSEIRGQPRPFWLKPQSATEVGEGRLGPGLHRKQPSFRKGRRCSCGDNLFNIGIGKSTGKCPFKNSRGY